MFFKKEKKSLADTMFFDKIKDTTKDVRKNLKKFKKDMSDIDGCYKILAQKHDMETIFLGLLIREDEVILEIIFNILGDCRYKKIDINKEIYNDIEQPGFLYDKYISFIGKIYDGVCIDEKSRYGFNELNILMYREIYEVEKARIDYIKKLANKKNIKIEDIKVDDMLFVLDEYYNSEIKKNPEQDKTELIFNILKAFPDKAFDKFGFSPFRPIAKK